MTVQGKNLGYSEDVLLASAAQTASGQTAALPGYGGAASLRVIVNVTAVSGTTPQLTVFIEDTLDGVTWNPLVSNGSPITSVGTTAFSVTGAFADRIRVRYAIAGTTPSFTFDVRAAVRA